MMTPVSPVWAKLAYASVIVLSSAAITEFVAELKDHKWNVVRTIIDFIKEW